MPTEKNILRKKVGEGVTELTNAAKRSSQRKTNIETVRRSLY